MTRTTGFVFHERYLWHSTGRQTGPFEADASGWLEPGTDHADSGEVPRRIRSLLAASGLLDQLTAVAPRAATEEEILRVHDPAYVERIRRESEAYGGDGGDGATPFARGSFEVARLSAGGAIVAVDAVLDGSVENAYALIRPPGHHALADRGIGFNLLANPAIAVHHALAARGLERVAVVDWDVHHANGTQAAFYADPRVLTISLHQDSNFPPGSGPREETGEGAGAGYNLNVPLPPGCGNGAYETAFERIVVPALETFEPQLILLVAGFDASAMDPLGRMMLTASGYGRLTRILLDLADRLCDGRLVAIHEGGYSPALVPFCALAVVEELAGVRTDVRDTILQQYPEGFAGQAVQPHQIEAIELAAANVRR